MKKLIWMAVIVMAAAISLPAQQGRGGEPLAFGDKDKDGICDATGKAVGQGRAAMLADSGQGQGRMGMRGRRGRGRGGQMARSNGRGRGGRGMGMRRQAEKAPAPEAPAESR